MENRKIFFIRCVIACSIALYSCSDSGYEMLKKKYPPEVFDDLFISAKIALLDELNNTKRGEFKEIEYSNDDCGVFVRLTNHGKERGCIGFIRGVSSLNDAVQAAIVNAALHDSRYNHLSKEELPYIDIEISIIDRLKKIDHYLDFNVGMHTIYIKYLNKSAVMQGHIALERGYGRHDFLRAVCRKGDIPETKYREKGAEIYRANTVFMKKKFLDINTER